MHGFWLNDTAGLIPADLYRVPWCQSSVTGSLAGHIWKRLRARGLPKKVTKTFLSIQFDHVIGEPSISQLNTPLEGPTSCADQVDKYPVLQAKLPFDTSSLR